MTQELKAFGIRGEENGRLYFAEVYTKRDVDAVLAEKDAFIKTLGEGQADLAREIERLKAETERLKRALFIAHAIKAKFKWWWMSECKHNESCKLFPDPHKIKKFTDSAWVCSKSQDKCRAKAEEYR